MKRFLFIRLALITSILFGAFLVCFQTTEFFKANQSKSWTKTTGVLSVAIDKHRKTLTYQYSVDGVTYNSDRVIFGEIGNRVRSKEWMAVSEAPNGSELTVYYNPDNPKQSSLFAKLIEGSWFSFVAGAVFLLMGGIPLVFLPRLKRVPQ